MLSDLLFDNNRFNVLDYAIHEKAVGVIQLLLQDDTYEATMIGNNTASAWGRVLLMAIISSDYLSLLKKLRKTVAPDILNNSKIFHRLYQSRELDYKMQSWANKRKAERLLLVLQVLLDDDESISKVEVTSTMLEGAIDITVDDRHKLANNKRFTPLKELCKKASQASFDELIDRQSSFQPINHYIRHPLSYNRCRSVLSYAIVCEQEEPIKILLDGIQNRFVPTITHQVFYDAVMTATDFPSISTLAILQLITQKIDAGNKNNFLSTKIGRSDSYFLDSTIQTLQYYVTHADCEEKDEILAILGIHSHLQ
ncbi:MAG: hypothetical protein AAF770_00500 [Bacteroidota bacterium]